MDRLREREPRAFIEARPEVVRVINLVSLQMGAGARTAVQAQMRKNQSAPVLAEQINAVDRGITRLFGRCAGASSSRT